MPLLTNVLNLHNHMIVEKFCTQLRVPNSKVKFRPYDQRKRSFTLTFGTSIVKLTLSIGFQNSDNQEVRDPSNV